MPIGKLKDFLGLGADEPENNGPVPLESQIMPEVQQEMRERAIEILDDEAGVTEKRLLREVQEEIQDAAEDSLKKLHLAQAGHCPACGEPLRRHLFAAICEGCGWHTYDVPRTGPVRIHLKKGDAPVEGDRCYLLKIGDVLLVKHDVVVARIARDAISWIEYYWTEDEDEQRYKQAVGRLSVICGWCGQPASPSHDGFHVVQVAFGSTQERHCFCSDDCYEAFRRMYPARVHRDCYERNCKDCSLCVRRYGEETEGIRMADKDFLQVDVK